MTKYRIEIFKKGARKPHDILIATLPNGSRPTYTKYSECFGGRLDRVERAKIRYDRSRGLVAEKYTDRKGNGRLRWF